MRKSEFNSLPLGLYRVFWTSGGASLAAIGQRSNGDRWLAPTNWIAPDLNNSLDGDGRSDWSKIERMEVLFHNPVSNPLNVDCPICGAARGQKCGYMANTGDRKHPLRFEPFPIDACPARVEKAKIPEFVAN
jgi:hypothetical protein